MIEVGYSFETKEGLICDVKVCDGDRVSLEREDGVTFDVPVKVVEEWIAPGSLRYLC